MEVLYDEDVASHIGPEPCVVSREGQGEASAGDRAGWPSSRESVFSRVPTVLPNWKATRIAALARAVVWPGVVRDPSMHGRSLDGNREISCLTDGLIPAGPRREGRMAEAGDARAREVGRLHSTCEASNKADLKSAAETVEGRRPVEGKASRDARPGLCAGTGMHSKRHAYGSEVHGPLKPRTSIAFDLRQEPGAGMPLAGICAGGPGQPGSLPRLRLVPHAGNSTPIPPLKRPAAVPFWST